MENMLSFPEAQGQVYLVPVPRVGSEAVTSALKAMIRQGSVNLRASVEKSGTSAAHKASALALTDGHTPPRQGYAACSRPIPWPWAGPCPPGLWDQSGRLG
jgi:hypothetical protein